MSRPDYGFFARLLHRFALGQRFIAQASFDLEEMTSRDGDLKEITAPVFIVGLARSGSTILLNALYQTGQYRSLTYRDMPFVLMSGRWKQLSATSRVQREARERAHGDRLLVNYDSPEAFEEVFWRTFCGEKYIFKDRVVPHQAAKSILQKFERFVHHVMNSRDNAEQVRYLSKNNNNLLRLNSLKRVFPDARIVIPFRDPLQQAQSLLIQHTLFLKMHGEDRFSMDYMMWLGHFEFGLGHKRYCYESVDNPYAPTEIQYWLQCWLDSYTYALKNAPEDAVFLGYEQTCDEPDKVFTQLLPRLDLHSDPEMAASYYARAQQHEAETLPGELFSQCQQLYQALKRKHADF